MNICMKTIAAGLTVLFLTACQPGETEFSGSAQGTTYHIKMVLPDHGGKLDEIRQAVEGIFADFDIKLSNYREDSEISKLNQQKSTGWLPISKEIADLVSVAKAVNTASEGCLDLTIKPQPERPLQPERPRPFHPPAQPHPPSRPPPPAEAVRRRPAPSPAAGPTPPAMTAQGPRT